MSDAAALAVDPPPASGQPIAAPRPARLAGLFDRFNPILVREIHQALNGKAFLFTAALALLAVLVIALLVAAKDETSPRDGATAFLNTLYIVVPILLFIVPLQAFFSMRSEVGGGTVEHLLMSRLTPSQIVRGKLLAAVVQFVIYLAIFAPLLALTYLLRGVDIPTIAMVLVMGFVMALACSALAIACGALCRWRAFFRVLPFAFVLIGLGWVTVSAMSALAFFHSFGHVRAPSVSDEFLFALLSMTLAPLVATVLFSMIGASALAHPYENRSTRFRVFAILAALLSFGWVMYSYEASDQLIRDYYDMGERLRDTGVACGVFLGLFALFASTEARTLSPRVRRRVPRSGLLALLVSPLLPGCGRGFLFTLLLTSLVLGGVQLVPVLWDVMPPSEGAWGMLLGVWLYVLLFSGIGCAVRRRLSDADARNWWARASMPILMLLSALLPLLVGVLGGYRGTLRRWNPLHIFNPFPTLGRLHRSPDNLGWLAGAAAVAILINLPTIIGGVREVLEASRIRRQRAP